MKETRRNAQRAWWPMSVLLALPWLVGAKDDGCAFGGQVIVGAGPDGGSCTPQDCQGQPVLTDAKICPDGTALGRSECAKQRSGQCGWDFPACPPFDGGGVSPSDAGGGGNGTPSCSAGIVTFELVVDVPASDSGYCPGANDCSGSFVTVTTPDGQSIVIPPQACSTLCDGCVANGCPAICALPRPIGSDGVTQEWNGRYYTSSTCGGGTACLAAQCIRTGTSLVATMCASPRINGAAPYCEVSANKRCVDVPFVYPPTGTVTGVLRPNP